MRGLFTFACFLFILPTIIVFLLWANLALAILALMGQFLGWAPHHLLQLALLAWLLVVAWRFALRRGW